jgi:subtilisin-like proprotein convertase family protein
LGAFGGQSIAGTWRLTVADLASLDQGALLGWCLQVNSRAPVLTAFTCGSATQCTVALGQPFSLTFTVTDPDANATAWSRLRGSRLTRFSRGSCRAI